jgi:hypothetical protein
MVGILQIAARKAPAIAREDWTLLAIAGTHGLIPIQLQRTLYLLGERFPKLAAGGFYEFRPISSGDYYSEQIYRDAEALSQGLVAIGSSERDGRREYRVTPAGAGRARALAKHVRPALLHELHTLAAWERTRSVDQLGRGSSATAPAEPSDPSRRVPGRSH